MSRNICVVGLGYIGLPTATMFSMHGHNVTGVDINKDIIENLNRGKITIEEPYLEELVKEVVKKGKLAGSLSPKESDVFIISVPTPIKEDKTADLKYVISAAKSIIEFLKPGNIVVLESTSPVGTTEEILKPIIEKAGFNVGKDIFLGYSPERVIPGKVIYELKNNDRIIGGINKISAEKIKEVYETIVDANIYLTDCKTAEMCKLMENTYRDVNIALSNELLLICDKLGINGWEVIELSNKHRRVNLHIPGPGVGGHCLAVDPWFIVEKEPNLAKIIEASRILNDSMPDYVYKTIEDIFFRELENKPNLDNITKESKVVTAFGIDTIKTENKVVTILGITYKANIDDIRESPIIKLIDELIENGYGVKIFDPYVKDFYLNKKSIISACENSDLLVLGVNHDIFKELPLKEIKETMRGDIILDTRNYLDKEKVEQAGFKYKVLGC